MYVHTKKSLLKKGVSLLSTYAFNNSHCGIMAGLDCATKKSIRTYYHVALVLCMQCLLIRSHPLYPHFKHEGQKLHALLVCLIRCTYTLLSSKCVINIPACTYIHSCPYTLRGNELHKHGQTKKTTEICFRLKWDLVSCEVIRILLHYYIWLKFEARK